MKLIKAIIRPNKVDDVRQSLEKASLSGMTVTEVRGHGRQKGHKAVYRGREYDVSLLPKTMIEMVVADDVADEVVRLIIEAARTGDIGDGRVFVLPIEDGHNIRTGLRDVL
jgi:nitrogen regulatory protein P-II 1